MENYEDADLLQRLRAEDAAAFRSLYGSCFRMVSSHVVERGGSRDDAEDLFQEALFVLVKKTREPDFRLTSRLSTFLFSVARNLFLQRLENRKRNPAQPSAEAQPDRAEPPDATEKLEEKDHWLNAVERCLERLEADCRRVLLMSFFEKRAQAEIAAELGYAENFVKVKKHRCLGYLRKAVADELKND